MVFRGATLFFYLRGRWVGVLGINTAVGDEQTTVSQDNVHAHTHGIIRVAELHTVMPCSPCIHSSHPIVCYCASLQLWNNQTLFMNICPTCCCWRCPLSYLACPTCCSLQHSLRYFVSPFSPPSFPPPPPPSCGLVFPHIHAVSVQEFPSQLLHAF